MRHGCNQRLRELYDFNNQCAPDHIPASPEMTMLTTTLAKVNLIAINNQVRHRPEIKTR